MNWKIARRKEAYQSSDSNKANSAAIPRCPTDESGPQAKTSVDKTKLAALIRRIYLALPYIK